MMTPKPPQPNPLQPVTSKWPASAPHLSYFSPSRPNLGTDQKQIIHPEGYPYGTILPSLIISPESDGSFRLWGWFPTGKTTASPKFCIFSSWEELSAGYMRWLECPEKFACDEMGWEPEKLEARFGKPLSSSPVTPAQRATTSNNKKEIDLDFLEEQLGKLKSNT